MSSTGANACKEVKRLNLHKFYLLAGDLDYGVYHHKDHIQSSLNHTFFNQDSAELLQPLDLFLKWIKN